ncbi:Methionine synthase [uncultured Clostridium sp.]|uniref:Homocysteine S-methyltransferase family protein n=1 Tax=Muricoprocola aceti TaxID=2981772 RepID=A0ABT2SN09_9FIRM|nr:homocysteine S-methyltransferase family protein [Muricoprocola aceti]MCI7227925.1 homocysteine S-methyltransferase family protein [Lachnospiraceae bacterium]SCH59399.1 Methionine synthase [uncultured Clostridium sp.]MCU6725645.1 homocysteine S-methyltransferase family protein [Muricoprocola aceti]MDD7435990.1 homocysteine S-methyltransferase family protein [Lachnospiraceae bacterium]MDY3341502.1 homocysteine S-methyltransferase family protein [Lachnospiraceae bacterium]
MTKEEFQKLAEKAILLDGATGSNLFVMGMPRGICSEEWILDHPDVLVELQKAYVEAGSQILCAPTFGANRFNLSSHGLGAQVEEMNHELVKISKKAVDGKAYVAGDVTAIVKMIGMSPEATYEKAMERYKEQMRYLVDAGVDVILMETMTSMDEAMAALEAAQQVCDLPVLCSMTIDADGSIYAGGHIFEAAETLQEMGADAVGINCSVGPEQLVSIVEGLNQRLHIPMIVKPNAGMPKISDTGEASYDMTPERFGRSMKVLLEKGAKIVGGCCGTTPDYIRELKKII